MIKIKDYIFNENDIAKIMAVKKEENKSNFDKLYVFFKNENIADETFYDTTFEDIEWNYEDKQIRNCLDSIYREEELEEENKKLKELCDKYEEEHNNEFQCWKKDRKELLAKRKIIDKAIEYIRSEYTITDDDVYLALYGSDGTLGKLENILEGKENESN